MRLKYKIEFYFHWAREIIRQSRYADDQILEKDDARNCTTLEFTSVQFEQILYWLKTFGAGAVPLEPDLLVSE